MKDVEPKLIMHYFLNPPKDKANLIKEMRQLHVAPNGDTTVYWRFRMPMMSDRDNVALIRQQELKDEGGIFVQCMTVDRDDVPLVKGVIRMEQSISAWVRPHPIDDSITVYTEIDNMDMKGNIPSSLMNMLLASEVGKEFESMYKGIRKQ
jgi:hypothetical protein